MLERRGQCIGHSSGSSGDDRALLLGSLGSLPKSYCINELATLLVAMQYCIASSYIAANRLASEVLGNTPQDGGAFVTG